MNRLIKLAAISCVATVLSGCGTSSNEPVADNFPIEKQVNQTVNLDIAVETLVLDNGLTVLLHQDKSDPIVAFATIVHAGSNREKPGRTGFAHFFEHMSFNDSENVPMGANRKMIPELGGRRNGGTWSDGTIYYEVVPVDALDKLLWIDSDRFGYMINTVKEATLEREKQVVKNEKRQRVDNRPYGHTNHVIRKALYPKDHPYNWTVIGDLQDLQNATLDDVREFYDKFYVPSNATLVIAGDIDIDEIKVKVEQWFGEIKAGEQPADLKPMPVSLTANKKLYHLDNLAKLPELRMTFPTVEQYHKDAYALDVLGSILAGSKSSPLYQQVVKAQGLAPRVGAYQSSNELTGTFTLRVRANSNSHLDDVYGAINSAFESFEKNGFADEDLQRIKAGQETEFYYGVSSILDKALELGIYHEFAGSYEFINQDIANMMAVTREDVMDVYHRYIKDKPAVITSFVPKNKANLVLTGSLKADVVEEQIIAGAEKQFDESASDDFVKTPSKFDRSEPPLGEQPAVSIPHIWHDTADNGMKLMGIEHHELPLVNFVLRVNGGQWLDKPGLAGTANLLAKLMSEGTASKTATKLEQAIGLLGARIKVDAGRENIVIEGDTLAKHFDDTMALVTEMLLSPRWDEANFARIKAERLTKIEEDLGDPDAIAARVFRRMVYGDDHFAGQAFGGDKASVAMIEFADVKDWYANNMSPQVATLHVVGAVDAKQVQQAAVLLNKKWRGGAVDFPKQKRLADVAEPKVYFVDVPNAKQSTIFMGKAGLMGDDAEFEAANMANMRLGAGTSARLMQVLRIEKGYTYGAGSQMLRTQYEGPFMARTRVRSNVTLESLQIIKDLVGNYAATFDEDDLATTKNLISKGLSRRFEQLDNLQDLLMDVSAFNLPDDYMAQKQDLVKNMSLTEIKSMMNKHMNEQQMIYVVVGDAKTQLQRMAKLGYGQAIVLDVHGNRL